MNIEKLISEYKCRIANHETMRDAAQDTLREARRLGKEDELSALSAEVRRRNDLIQLCTQIIKDLESL